MCGRAVSQQQPRLCWHRTAPAPRLVQAAASTIGCGRLCCDVGVIAAVQGTGPGNQQVRRAVGGKPDPGQDSCPLSDFNPITLRSFVRKSFKQPGPHSITAARAPEVPKSTPMYRARATVLECLCCVAERSCGVTRQPPTTAAIQPEYTITCRAVCPFCKQCMSQ